MVLIETTILLSLAIFLIAIFGLLDFLAERRSYNGLITWSIFLLLTMLATFRSVGVGSDDKAYLDIFRSIPSLLECQGIYCNYSYTDHNIEFGFFLLLSLLSVFGSSQYIMFGVVAFFSVFLNLKNIQRFSPHISASALVYFSHFFLGKEMNAIRVGLASGLLFYASHLLAKKKYSLMVFFLALATSIHLSAILFVVPMVVFLISPSRNFFVFSMMILLFASWLFDFKMLFGHLIDTDFAGNKLQLYLNAEEYSYALPLFDLVNIKNLLAIGLSLLLWHKLSKRYAYFYLSFCFFFCAAFFRITFGDFAIFAGRGYAVISMFEYILIPYLAYGLLGRPIGYLVVCLYAFITLFLNLTTNLAWSGGADFFSDLI